MGLIVIRVLQVTSKLFRGGAEAFIMNVYRNIDRSKMQFDFLVFHAGREYFEDEIEALGGRIFHVPIMEKANILRRKDMLDAFFRAHHDYEAVHCHMAALGRDCLLAAAKYGIDKRISHSHIADFERTPRNYVKQAFQRGFGDYATRRLACSEAAGQFMYRCNDFEVINNGIDIDHFTFEHEKRATFRKSLGFCESDRLIGHVGRFELMKNHAYLIDVFDALCKFDKSSYLLLAGEGSLLGEIEDKVEVLDLSGRVRFLGLVDDMPSFYDGIDCFIMPSLFEGLPFSAVEAQCSGLPCVLSSAITEEVAITSLVEYLNLDAGLESWAAAIEDNLLRNASYTGSRVGFSQAVGAAGYDIKAVAAKLTQLYLS